MVVGFSHIPSYQEGLKDMCTFACESEEIAEFKSHFAQQLSDLDHRCRANESPCAELRRIIVLGINWGHRPLWVVVKERKKESGDPCRNLARPGSPWSLI